MVRIVTDSCADMPPEIMEKHRVACVPLSVTLSTGTYRENIDLGKERFYELLSGETATPRTSQPSPADFESVFAPAMTAGDDMVCVLMSSGLSGTYQGACMVRDQLEYKNCYIVDTLCATGGQRILLDEAIRMRDEGKSAKEIFDALETLKTRVNLNTMMNTLEFLYRGGRISKAVYMLGAFARLKPIMHVSPEGRPEIVFRAPGVNLAFKYLSGVLENAKPDTAYPLYVMYTGDRANGERLARIVRDKGYTVDEAHIMLVGATVGSHIGPGAAGFVYIRKEEAQNVSGFREKAEAKVGELRDKAGELREKAGIKAEELRDKAGIKAEELRDKAGELREKAENKTDELRKKLQDMLNRPKDK